MTRPPPIKSTLLTESNWRLVESESIDEKWVYIERFKGKRDKQFDRLYVLWHTNTSNPYAHPSLGLFPGNCKQALNNPNIPLNIKRVVEAYLIMDM